MRVAIALVAAKFSNAVAAALLFAAAFALGYVALAGRALAADSGVTVPFGDWIVAAAPILGIVLLLAIVYLMGWAVKLLPPWASVVLGAAEQKYLIGLAAQALNEGVQLVQNAEKGKTLTLPVGSSVIAQAAQTFLNKAPAWVADKLGGADGVKKFILSQAEDHGVILPADSTVAEVLAHPAVAAVSGPR